MIRQSYATVQQALDFLSTTSSNGSWLVLTPEQQLNTLYDASDILDTMFIWPGYKSDNLQILGWPRTNVYSCESGMIPSDVVPREVIIATILTASQLKPDQSPFYQEESNVSRVKVGPIDISLDATLASQNNQPVSEYVKSLLRYLGTYKGPKDSVTAYSVEAVR